MNIPAHYLHWGFILISYPNLFLIVGMMALFVVALVAPFPSHREDSDSQEHQT